MKVSELIKALGACKPDAIVEVEDCESRANVEGIERVYYDNPKNSYVVLKSALSVEPNEARKNQKRLQELEHKLEQVKKAIS